MYCSQDYLLATLLLPPPSSPSSPSSSLLPFPPPLLSPFLPPSSIAVITKGKYSVLEAGALPQLVTLLSDEDSEVRLNSIKVRKLLSSLAYVKGRESNWSNHIMLEITGIVQKMK